MADSSNRELSLEEMEAVSGGASGYDSIHDLGMFVYRTVVNVIHYDDTCRLTMHETPDGTVIPGVGWQNGEQILVHVSYRESNWYYAYKNGIYGYVNPNYVC